MTNAELFVYNVGHGVCALLIGDKADGTKYCGVFDCGTIAQNKDCPISTIIDDLAKRIKEIGHIDDIVISHQDSDHHNKLFTLISKLNNIQLDK